MSGSRIFKPLIEVKGRAVSGLKNYLTRRTPRQRLYIVLIAFLLFAVMDIWMVARSFSGCSRLPEMRHIETPVKS